MRIASCGLRVSLGWFGLRRYRNRKPCAAIGGVLGPHAPLLDGEQPARDRQPHAGPGGSSPRRGAAKKPLERCPRISLRDAGTAVAHADLSPRPDTDAPMSIARIGRCVLGRVLEQLRQRRGGQPRIESHEARRSTTDTATGWRCSACPTWSRAASTISDGCTQRCVVGDRAGVDACHLEDVIEKPRQPFDLRQHQIALVATIGVGEPRRLQVAGGDANRGERRAQIVRERRQAAPTSAPRAGAPVRPTCSSSRKCARSIAIAATPPTASSAPASGAAPDIASRPIGLAPRRSGTNRQPADLRRDASGGCPSLDRACDRPARQLARDRASGARPASRRQPLGAVGGGRSPRSPDRSDARSPAPGREAPAGCRSSAARRG